MTYQRSGNLPQKQQKTHIFARRVFLCSQKIELSFSVSCKDIIPKVTLATQKQNTGPTEKVNTAQRGHYSNQVNSDLTGTGPMGFHLLPKSPQRQVSPSLLWVRKLKLGGQSAR